MRKHGPNCKAMATRDQDEKEVSKDDKSDEDDGYPP